MSLQLGFFGQAFQLPDEEDPGYRGDWETPWGTVHQIERELGVRFGLDVSAAAHNAKAPAFFTAEQDGLLQDWIAPAGTWYWCNPDFRLAAEFVYKAYQEFLQGREGLLLLPNNTDRPMWTAIEDCGSDVQVLFWGEGRINFMDPTTRKRTSNTKGSILVAFTRQETLPRVNGRKWWKEART
jgi:phage N-6-adenine-methyltransferase